MRALKYAPGRGDILHDAISQWEDEEAHRINREKYDNLYDDMEWESDMKVEISETDGRIELDYVGVGETFVTNNGIAYMRVELPVGLTMSQSYIPIVCLDSGYMYTWQQTTRVKLMPMKVVNA